MAALKSFTDDGLFIGQTQGFFDYLRDLAEDADDARREHGAHMRSACGR